MNRENWEVKKLGEVCETSSGGTPSRKKTEYYESGTISWLRSGEINQRYINNSELKITELGLYNSSAKIFPKGTVLVAMYGATVGQVGVLNFNSSTNQAICGILPNENINNSFLYYFLKSKKDSFLKQAMGGAQPNISQDIIRRTPLPIPPLPIQEVIVKELDTLHRLKELQEQQLAEYDNLAQSTFYSMFGDPIENERGWEVDCLENVCIRKGEYGAGSSAIPFDEIKPRYIRITDINESGALNVEKVSPSNKLDFEKYQLLDGDILFARSGATVGKTYLHSPENGNCIFAGYLIRFMVDRKKIIPIFLFHYTKTEFYKDWIASRQRVVAQPNINAKQYGELSVFIPPLPLQAQFADRIKKIDEQKELIKQSIAQTQMLIDYTMDKYFN